MHFFGLSRGIFFGECGIAAKGLFSDDPVVEVSPEILNSLENVPSEA